MCMWEMGTDRRPRPLWRGEGLGGSAGEPCDWGRGSTSGRAPRLLPTEPLHRTGSGHPTEPISLSFHTRKASSERGSDLPRGIWQ